jgi:HSP20 family protein
LAVYIKDATCHIRKHRNGSFERSFMLPAGVQTGQDRADFENGVLTTRMPKAETVKPKTIDIKAK